ALAELDVRAVIAPERRLDVDAVPARAEQLTQDAPSLRDLAFARRIERPAEIPRAPACLDQLGVLRIVRLAGEHLLPFAPHRPSFGTCRVCRACQARWRAILPGRGVTRPSILPRFPARPRSRSAPRTRPAATRCPCRDS